MRAEIISVGTELLLGDILNTNAQFLAQELAALGYSVYYQTVVGDNTARLRELVISAKQRSDLLIFTGGLGPTDDDLTKETVAGAYGDSLVMDDEELARIQGFFKKQGRTMPVNNTKQAMVPKNGKKLPNANGTAPGAFFRQGDKYAFLLPGPPGEMQPMFLEQVRPVLEEMQDSAIRSKTLRVFGVGESELEGRVIDLLESSNPTAALYAKVGEVHIRITAKAGTAENAELMCDEYSDLFYKVLGDIIYSEDGADLETTVVRQLIRNGERVATAESCTGGLLSERITTVPGASGVFGFGATTYANEAKHQMLGVRGATLRRWGAVSGQVAAEMAFGAARKGGADYGVGITGIAGPDGGTPEKPVGLVYIGVAHGSTVHVKKIQVTGRSREVVRRLATQHALDMLRRLSDGLPLPDAKIFARSQIADVEREGRPQRRGSGALRFVAAFLVVALLLALVTAGFYASRRENASVRAALPSAAGLAYGSEEYTLAACALVTTTREMNPAVAGLITLPAAGLESFVATTKNNQDELKSLDGQPAVDGMASLPGDATVGRMSTNTLLLGGSALEPLTTLATLEEGASLGTFTYFTERDARVYEILSVYLLDTEETQPDGFNPSLRSLAGYQTQLTWLLGLSSRSLYSPPGDAPETLGSFMTLTAQHPTQNSWRVYVTGRQVGTEQTSEAVARRAVAPLMPAAYYRDSHQRAPDRNELSAGWLRSYLDSGVTNSALQLRAGMPATDKAPTVPRPEVAQTEPEEQPASEPPPDSGGEGDASGLPPEDDSAGGIILSGEAASNAGDATMVDLHEATPPASESPPPEGASPAGEAASLSGADSSAAAPPPASSSSAASAPPRPAITDVNQRPDLGYLTVTMNGEKLRDTTANILAMICQREVGAGEPALIKAQAIAAHSWILNQQGSGNKAPAVAGEAPSAEVLSAVEEVASQVLSDDGNAPAFTPYYGRAAMATNSADAVWGSARGYLTSVSSAYDQGAETWREIRTLTEAEVAELVAQNLGVDLAASGIEANGWFSELAKNDGGYVVSLKVGEDTLSGLELWQRVLTPKGVPLLKSPAFEIDYTGEGFTFTCYGEGHGVGLSQAGARYMAEEGKTFEEILGYYFPGIRLITWE